MNESEEGQRRELSVKNKSISCTGSLMNDGEREERPAEMPG